MATHPVTASPDERARLLVEARAWVAVHEGAPGLGITGRLLLALAQVEDTLATVTEEAAILVATLRKAIVVVALPYEALRMDNESRKWIAPTIWKAIVESTEVARAAIAATAAEAREDERRSMAIQAERDALAAEVAELTTGLCGFESP